MAAPKSRSDDPAGRIGRELKTVQKMIGLYCRDHHQTSDRLCPSCQDLADYARRRLLQCPFQENKTTCTKCAVHCYKPDMKKRIVEVMRYAGPRMMLHHPILALRHLLDERRSAPADLHVSSNQASKRKK